MQPQRWPCSGKAPLLRFPSPRLGRGAGRLIAAASAAIRTLGFAGLVARCRDGPAVGKAAPFGRSPSCFAFFTNTAAAGTMERSAASTSENRVGDRGSGRSPASDQPGDRRRRQRVTPWDGRLEMDGSDPLQVRPKETTADVPLCLRSARIRAAAARRADTPYGPAPPELSRWTCRPDKGEPVIRRRSRWALDCASRDAMSCRRRRDSLPGNGRGSRKDGFA